MNHSVHSHTRILTSIKLFPIIRGKFIDSQLPVSSCNLNPYNSGLSFHRTYISILIWPRRESSSEMGHITLLWKLFKSDHRKTSYFIFLGLVTLSQYVQTLTKMTLCCLSSFPGPRVRVQIPYLSHSERQTHHTVHLSSPFRFNKGFKNRPLSWTYWCGWSFDSLCHPLSVN